MCTSSAPLTQTPPRSKIGQCNDLIEIINRGVQNLEKGHRLGSDPSEAEELRSMAEAMDEIAKKAAEAQLTYPTLQKYSTEYQTMAKDVAKAARDMADAVKREDPDRINAAQRQMGMAVKREDSIVGSINTFCQAP